METGKKKSRDRILDVRQHVLSERTGLLFAVDRIGWLFTHPIFFLCVLLFHLGWIAANLPIYPFDPFDPYPFTFLATIASIEAPFLTILVLMYQRRNSRISELRDETHLQITLHVEREASMTLRLLQEIQRKLEIETRQEVERLEELQEELDPMDLMDRVRKDLQGVESTDPVKSV